MEGNTSPDNTHILEYVTTIDECVGCNPPTNIIVLDWRGTDIECRHKFCYSCYTNLTEIGNGKACCLCGKYVPNERSLRSIQTAKYILSHPELHSDPDITLGPRDDNGNLSLCNIEYVIHILNRPKVDPERNYEFLNKLMEDVRERTGMGQVPQTKIHTVISA